jgi:hypothetical protein
MLTFSVYRFYMALDERWHCLIVAVGSTKNWYSCVKQIILFSLITQSRYVLVQLVTFTCMLNYFNPCTVHLVLFCTVKNKCAIISQIITLLHVSTLSCHPQAACNQYRAKLHKYYRLPEDDTIVLKHVGV